MSIQSGEILETVKMVADQHFDVRTITIGIDLHDCISTDIDVLNQNIYNKITTVGKDLVATAKHLSAKYGVPIVNQRISVTPIAQIAAATKADSYVSVAQTLDKAAKAIGVSFIGGFSALVQKGMSPSDEVLIRSIPEAMKTTDIVCSSINIGSTRAGINMDAVRLAGETIKRTAEITPEGFGCAKIVVFCNAVEDNPFMAGAFHGAGEADAVINVGVSGPGVVKAALENSDAVSLTEVAEVVKKTAFKITRVGSSGGRSAHGDPVAQRRLLPQDEGARTRPDRSVLAGEQGDGAVDGRGPFEGFDTPLERLDIPPGCERPLDTGPAVDLHRGHGAPSSSRAARILRRAPGSLVRSRGRVVGRVGFSPARRRRRSPWGRPVR